jgi:hypothetical protein
VRARILTASTTILRHAPCRRIKTDAAALQGRYNRQPTPLAVMKL